MRIRFLADDDLVAEFVAATLRMRLAAAAGRVSVTSDCAMPKHLTQVIRVGLDSPGVLLVIPQSASIGAVAETLFTIWAASEPEEWTNRVTKIPL